MAGGIMQLTARGAQNIYLNDNPQITFFKKVYRRHSNFAMENINAKFDFIPSFRGDAITAICKIPRSGDLVRNIYLKLDLPAVTDNGNFLWTRNLGTEFIKRINILVGGNLIDTIPEHWITIYNELTLNEEKKNYFNELTGNTYELHSKKGNKAAKTLYIPLPLFFSKSPGTAIPLVALQYHELELHIEFNPITDMYSGTPTETLDISEISLDIEYIFLESEERDRFARVDHQYLIDTIQFTKFSDISPNANLELKLQHPIKEFIFVLQKDDINNVDSKQHSNFTSNHLDEFSGNDILTSGKLQINGNDRFQEINLEHFKLIQPFQHHSSSPSVEYYKKEIININMSINGANTKYIAIPRDMDLIKASCVIDGAINGDTTITLNNNGTDITNGVITITASGSAAGTIDTCSPSKFQNFTSDTYLKITSDAGNSAAINANITLEFQTNETFKKLKKGIYLYSFSLNPEEFQPSGTINASVINNMFLILKHQDTNINCFFYAVTYNIFRVIAGLGNKVFSN
jgi:hypothetical protein